MGLFKEFLGAIAETISDDIRRQTGVDLSKEFSNVKRSYKDYKETKADYFDLINNKAEYIEKYGEEAYYEMLQVLEEEKEQKTNMFTGSINSSLHEAENDTYEHMYTKAKVLFGKMSDVQLRQVLTDRLSQPQMDAYYEERSRRGI